MRGLFRSHPFLWRAGLIGAGVYVALELAPNTLAALTRALITWDVFALAFVAMLVIAKRRATPEVLAAHAKHEDEGRHAILALCILAAGASVAAIAFELSAARDGPAAARGARIALAFATIALSWTFTHFVFASHYAHEYYAPDEAGGVAEGLTFHGGQKPDFWDFVHFSFVIGAANQTADIDITSRPIRRTVTVHGIVAFLFNTVVLAVSINFAASLFAPT